MANEIVGKVVQLVEMDVDVYRATQFETLRDSPSLELGETRLLVQYEGLDGATTFTDSSIVANVLTGAGGAVVDHDNRKFGGAGLFNGAGARITFPVNDALLLHSEDFTIETWFNYQGTLGTGGNIIAHTDSAFTQYTWSLYVNNQNELHFDLATEGFTDEIEVRSITKFSNLLNTGWHHAAVVRSGTRLLLFVDGVLEDEEPFPFATNPSTVGLSIGANDNGSFPWTGWLDDTKITIGVAKWTENFTPPTSSYKVPSSTALLLHFDPGGINGLTDIRDFSANNRTVTVGGNAQVDTSESKFGGGSLVMDGIGDFVSVPASPDLNLGAEDFTVDFWFFMTNPTGAQVNICGQSDASFTAGSSGWFIIRTASSLLQATVMQGSTQINCQGTLPFNNLENPGWHHFAFVRRGDRLNMFLDGVPHGSQQIVDGYLNDSAFATSVGRVGEIAGNTFQGWIDEFRIVKGEAKYRGTFTPKRRAYSLQDFPPDNWSVHWNPQNVVLSKVDVPEFPSGQGLHIVKTVNDGGQQSFIKYDLIEGGLHNVSLVGLFQLNAPVAVGGATGFIARGETSSIRGYRLRMSNYTSIELAVLDPSATALASETFAFEPGEAIWIRYDVAETAGGGALHRAKWWRGERTDEPGSFMLVHDEVTAVIQNSGNAGYVGITCPGANTFHDNYCGFFRAQSLISYQNETLRFAVPTSYLPVEYNATPNVIGITQTPVTLSLGENLGTRAQVSVTFRDHLHAERGEFYNSGTYWGRWRARNLFRRVQPLNIKTGLLAHDIEEFEVRHYYLESFDGPTFDDKMTVLAQDVIKLADNDKAQAPVLNNGFLAADITAVQTTAALLPTGIGDQEYATSGYLAIGGEEIVAFVRSGDILNITRAQFGTTAQEHDSEDRVQQCLEYNSDTAPFIIHDLFTTYAGMNADLIDLPTWELEAATYLQRQYTRLIAEPTGVNKLVTELIQQAGLIIWNDTLEDQIRFQVIRGISTTAFEYNEENVLMGATRVNEQRNKIITEAWVYYGVKNPLEPLDQANNYRSAIAVPNLEASTLNGAAVIKKTFGTWMPAFARDTAERVVDLLLSRFSVPPRRINFAVPRHSGIMQPIEAGGYQFRYHGGQDELGGEVTMPVQVVRVEPKEDKLIVEAEEMLFTAFDEDDLVNRVITVDANINGFNLKTVHDAIYPEITAGDVVASPPVTLTCIVNAGVIVGGIPGTKLNTSGNPSLGNFPAFDVGTGWPTGLQITIQVIGRIQGYGGFGGDFTAGSGDGWQGGTALYTRFPIHLDLSSGVAQIWGGGGGGGAAFHGSGFHGGGGGQGQPGGAGGDIDDATGTDGGAGTSETRGAGGFNGGEGGTPDIFADGDGGAAGQTGETDPLFGRIGGPAGWAIDGLTFVNFLTGYGDIRGPQVN